jgi:hypothetical protein
MEPLLPWGITVVTDDKLFIRIR